VTFDEAEAQFRERQAHRKPWVPLNQAEFEAEMSELMLPDERGVWWSIHPERGEWMYYDGAQWVEGARPGRIGSARSSHLEEKGPRTSSQGPSPSRRLISAVLAEEPKYVRAIGAG
jgi:hypothetical protein